MKYEYQSDLEKYGTSLDIWEIISPDANGVYRGDCESYCRTLKSIDNVYKDWDYYYCKLDGVGHCVLIKDGMIIDCNVKDVVSLDTYCKVYNVSGFKKYSLFTIGSKIMFSWGYLLWRKLLR